MKYGEINNLNQSQEKCIYKSTLSVNSYLQSTTFLPKNIIYNLHVLTLSDLQSTMKIINNGQIYNLQFDLTPPPPLNKPLCFLAHGPKVLRFQNPLLKSEASLCEAT